MAYDKSAITETPSAVPSQPLPQMREERTVDPYRINKPKVMAPIGEPDINSEQKKEAESGEVAPVKEESITLSPQMAALARKEQKFRQNELNVKRREEALAAREANISRLEELEKKLKADDYSGVEDLVKYDKYTNYLIEKDTQLTPEQKAVKELNEKVSGVEKRIQEDVEIRFEAAVNERRKAVQTLVETNQEFSSIKEMKAEEAVVKHILDTWEHDQIDLSPEEAAKEVEEILLETANKWNSLSKLKNKLNPNEVTEDKHALPPLRAPIKTLTNNMAATGEIKRVQKPLGQMSDSERWAEARRRAEEKLQKGIRQ